MPCVKRQLLALLAAPLFSPWLTQQLSLLWPLLPMTSKSLPHQQLVTEARPLLYQEARSRLPLLARNSPCLGRDSWPRSTCRGTRSWM